MTFQIQEISEVYWIEQLKLSSFFFFFLNEQTINTTGSCNTNVGVVFSLSFNKSECLCQYLPCFPLQDYELLSIYAGSQGVSELTLKTFQYEGYLEYQAFK